METALAILLALGFSLGIGLVNGVSSIGTPHQNTLGNDGHDG